MGIRTEGIGDVYMFILVVLFGTLGEKLEESPMGGYSCPKYCEVDHDHIMELNGRISDIRAIRTSRSSDSSFWLFHMEAESLDSK